MDEQTREELLRLLKIAKVIGGMEGAISWIQVSAKVTTVPEPDGHKDKVPWMKWYRNTYGVSLKDAVEEWKRLYDIARITE